MASARTSSPRGTWGGKRAGAGRKPGPRPLTPHRARNDQRPSQPVLVTLSSRLDSLRSPEVFPSVRLAIQLSGAREPQRFRIVHFSVQRAHVHLLVEAKDARSLSSGIRSVSIRIARYVNDLLERTGKLWGDRYRCRALSSARDVRAALVLVLGGFRAHAERRARPGIDPYSSGAWFDGWRSWQPGAGAPPFAERVAFAEPHAVALRGAARAAGRPASDAHGSDAAAPVLEPRTPLLREGWRRHGLLELDEIPPKAP